MLMAGKRVGDGGGGRVEVVDAKKERCEHPRGLSRGGGIF